MYYRAYTVRLVPGKRFPGVDHLKKMGKILHDKYGIKSEVLANASGKVYLHHLVSRYESLAQLEEVEDKLMADAEYHAWFDASTGLIEWADASSHVYRVFD